MVVQLFADESPVLADAGRREESLDFPQNGAEKRHARLGFWTNRAQTSPA
jgi:hypothetical protein